MAIYSVQLPAWYRKVLVVNSLSECRVPGGVVKIVKHISFIAKVSK